MERRSWCTSTWDMMDHSACYANSHTHSCFSTVGQSSSCILQTAGYNDTDWHSLPADTTTSLQNMYTAPLGIEITPQDMLQYFPDLAPAAIQQRDQTSPVMVTSECNPRYHHHRQRDSSDPSTPKENDEMPMRRREQNRIAQRAFRKRREENTSKLSNQLSRLIQEHQTLLEADLRQADQVQALKTQIAALDARLELMRRQRDLSSSTSPTSELFDGFLMGGGVDTGDSTSLFLNEFAANGGFDFTAQENQDSS